MKKVLITGADGFIGRNLTQYLRRMADPIEVLSFEVGDSEETLQSQLSQSDLVIHLAGVNRPQSPEEFSRVNRGLTERIVDYIAASGRSQLVALASSTQALLDNPYGISKRQAEEVLDNYARRCKGAAVIFRLTNVFGKGCRPNYNSVIATFCHNLARNLPITINDPNRLLELVYIDDVVDAFAKLVNEDASAGTCIYREVKPAYTISLQRLAEILRAFEENRNSLLLPDVADPLTRRLYSTYLSYLPGDQFSYLLQQREDQRGVLAELLKSPSLGQIFLSRTKPGVTRGNHYHDSKVEKFCVLEGQAVIRLRQIDTHECLQYCVNGREFKVVDIPPGYTHSIENVGDQELIVLFWANEPFDPANPDTYALPVIEG